MLALAIEFSRCSRARTLKAEQCARRRRSSPRGRFPLPQQRSLEAYSRLEGAGIADGGQCIDLESSGMQHDGTVARVHRYAKGSLERR
jgi:hypothetical protein